MGNRGILIAVDTELNRKTRTLSSGPHNKSFALNLRRWSLFWDRIGIALNGNLMARPHPDIDFLASTELVKYIDVTHKGGEGTAVTHEVNLQALYWLEDTYPGDWAIDLSPGSLYMPNDKFLPEGHTLEGRGALVQLHNVIPVPDTEVPLEEILNFKERRRPELLELRHTLDDLYQGIGNAQDPAHALSSAADKIASGSNTVIRSLRERNLPFRLSKELVSINLVSAVVGGAGSFAAGQPILTALGNAAAGAITIGASVEWLYRKRAGSPYEYVALYHSEVFRD